MEEMCELLNTYALSKEIAMFKNRVIWILLLYLRN